MTEFPEAAPPPPPIDEDAEEYFSSAGSGGASFGEDDGGSVRSSTSSLGAAAAERVAHFYTSLSAANRRRAAKELPDALRYSLAQQNAAEGNADDGDDAFGAILRELLADSDAGVRQTACEALSDAAAADLTARARLRLLAAAAECCGDASAAVRRSATAAVAAVSALLLLRATADDDDADAASSARAAVQPVVLRLAADKRDEDRRAEAATLVAAFAAADALPLLLPADVAAPLLSRLAQDVSVRVRGAVAASVGDAAAGLGEAVTTEQLLPLFLRLCQDEIWSVRRACAEGFVAVARRVRSEPRQRLLVPALRALLEDQSRWVRSAAFESFGQFLTLLDSAAVGTELLGVFASMATEETSRRLGDSDLRQYAAFCLPGVLQTLGSARWPELRATFSTLAEDLQWKVRRSLACSLHVVAQLLGGGAAVDEELSATFEAFIRDIDEVRSGVLAHAARFITFLTPDARERLLPLISELHADTSWRIRKILAKQLGPLAEIYHGNDFFQEAALQLSADPVASVRRVAAKSVGDVWTTLGDAGARDLFAGKIVEFGQSDAFGMRLVFVSNMCPSLARRMPPTEFQARFLPTALLLSRDKVSNVRVGTARLLQTLVQLDVLAELPEIISATVELARDSNKEVAAEMALLRELNLQQQHKVIAATGTPHKL